MVATASPFKFPRFVLESLGETIGKDPFEDLKRLSNFSGQMIPEPLRHLETANLKEARVCSINDMEQAVSDVLDV